MTSKKSNPIEKKGAKPIKKDSPNRTYTWDVIAAEKEYLSDSRVSYSAISKKYGVTLRTVQRYATSHEWPKRRQNVVEKGLEKFEDEQAKIISESNQRHISLFKNGQTAANTALVRILKAAKKDTDIPDMKDLSKAIYSLSEAIKGERTVLGLPTMIQSFGGGKDAEKEVATWADILASVEEARRDAGHSTKES